MNSLIVLCLAFVAVQAAPQALTPDQVKLLASHAAECQAQSKADQGQINGLKNGEFGSVNDALKQYTLCLMIKSQLINADGVLNKEVALAKTFTPDDKPGVDQAFTECQKLTSGAPQEVAWTFATCFHQKDQKYTIFQ